MSLVSHWTMASLKQIPNSTRFLSTNNSGAGGLAFSPDGRFLIVVERWTNDIDVFAVQGDSSLSPVVVNPSAGAGAFSVSFAPNGTALVSETGPSGVANGSAVSSYEIAANGALSPISTSVPTLGAANCSRGLAGQRFQQNEPTLRNGPEWLKAQTYSPGRVP